MEWIQNHWIDIWAIFSGIVTIASIVAKLTPNKWDDNFISKIISLMALNKK